MLYDQLRLWYDQMMSSGMIVSMEFKWRQETI